MQKLLDEMPFFISVPIMAFIVAFCRPNSDGTGNVGWRRFNQSVMSSAVALAALYATEAAGMKPQWAMVAGIFCGVMGWEYIKTSIEAITKKIIEKFPFNGK